jgi:ubiquinone/menaquinone biosynthesis C-methylase UbiE
MTHNRIISDEDQAKAYAHGHKKMAEMFGNEYAKKLSTRGFQQGRIIDVGCGFGVTNLVLAKNFMNCEFTGIDLSEPLLKIAREAAEDTSLGRRIKFEKADVQEIPYEDNSFDVVINTNMVHLVENPIKMLSEIERILTPDGHLFIADLRRSWLCLLEREIRSAMTMGEARDLFNQSELRNGTFRWGFLWWRFET